MGVFNPAIVCCCDQGLNLCCLSVTLSKVCPTSEEDPENCGMVPGDPQTVTWSQKFRYCVAKEEDCNCQILVQGTTPQPDGATPGPGGFVEQDVIDCQASYFADVKCDSPEAEEACSGGQGICPNWICGPCEPIISGCVISEDGTCPPVPQCEPKDCCTPPPIELCCCRTIVNGCITSASCEPCPAVPTSGNGQNGTVCGPVSNCDECDAELSVGITTLCCSSCYYSDSAAYGDPNPGDGIPEGWAASCPPGITTCCNDCLSGTCEGYACMPPCSQGPPANICPCPLAPTSPGCTAFQAQQRSTYGNMENSAEGNYLKGLIYDPSTGTYRQNTLLFFGYGYNQL
jgi:hypothetical protein